MLVYRAYSSKLYPMNTNIFILSNVSLQILFITKFPSSRIEMSVTLNNAFSIMVGVQILGSNN